MLASENNITTIMLMSWIWRKFYLIYKDNMYNKLWFHQVVVQLWLGNTLMIMIYLSLAVVALVGTTCISVGYWDSVRLLSGWVFRSACLLYRLFVLPIKSKWFANVGSHGALKACLTCFVLTDWHRCALLRPCALPALKSVFSWTRL